VSKQDEPSSPKQSKANHQDSELPLSPGSTGCYWILQAAPCIHVLPAPTPQLPLRTVPALLFITQPASLVCSFLILQFDTAVSLIAFRMRSSLVVPEDTSQLMQLLGTPENAKNTQPSRNRW